MGCGYFGKLPMRGDFVSRDCPAGFLEIWEPFLQEGLSQARLDLKEAWEEAYMTMPVWRFLIEPVGTDSPLQAAVAGAFMPNVDRVGRKYPLVLVAEIKRSGDGVYPSDKWFADLENTLLATLRDEATFEQFLSDFDALPEAETVQVSSKETDRTGFALAGPKADDLQSEFWTAVRGKTLRFKFSGMPEAAAFKVLVRPELSEQETGGSLAGDVHGQSREDLQT
ncbi:type VI secretion system-associated protein TagF [Labrenzia sp. PHM005]|uniref:type VI secretion system-associated protein TagF n=1 Tax=Labrenzia sp. PHM005 TaxID=2590016 RepID=UPI0021109158|nr:type VI secretion system-associated protein TagF [Labrenzia sp. PHM005]